MSANDQVLHVISAPDSKAESVEEDSWTLTTRRQMKEQTQHSKTK